jgi:hypothetical protein
MSFFCFDFISIEHGIFCCVLIKVFNKEENTNLRNDFHIHIVMWIFGKIKKKEMKCNFISRFSIFYFELHILVYEITVNFVF